MHHRRLRVLVAAGLLGPAAMFGCSVVYPYGDIGSPQTEEGGSDSASDGVALDQEAGSDVGAMTQDGPTVQDGPAADASSAADADAGPVLANAGAVVVGGEGQGPDGGLTYVLSVLDSSDGHELSREPFAVVGLAYDGGRDLWYIFETLNPGIVLGNGPFAPSPGDPVMLHIRQLNTHTGTWTELGKTPVPTIVSPDTIAPIQNRLAYISYAQEAGGEQLVVVDTTVPANAVADASDLVVSTTPLTFNPASIVGTRPLLASTAGGEVTMVQNTSLGGGGEFQFFTARIGSNTSVTTTPVILGASTSAFATVGAGSFLGGGPTNVFALPPGAPDAGPLLVQYDPVSGNKASAADIPFPSSSPRFRPLAVSECSAIAFVGQVTGTTILAIPLAAGGTASPFSVPNEVTNIRFDPYGNNLITAFNNGAVFGIAALSLGGTKTAPTLSARAGWVSPSDLHPTTIAVRSPVSFACPP